MRKDYLLAPGPTPVPPEVLLEMAKPVFHHRTSEYRKLHEEVLNDLKEVFRTKNDIFIIASSGTGAMESAVVNVLSPGDKALVIEGGKFGERWVELCETYGARTVVLKVEWGKAVDPEAVEAAFKEHPDIAAVYTTLVETSTAVQNDIEAIGAVVKKTDAILVVDGISGVGGVPLETDAWGVDMVAVGSQKALMLPPGLGFISVSKKAWERVDKCTNRSYYFDLKRARKDIAKFDNPFTPAITLILALKKALDIIKSRGIEQVWKDHARLAKATREAAKALGLKIYADPSSDCVTAICLPEGVDGEKLVKKLRLEYGITVAGGQSQLKGKIVRISHMGYIGDYDIIVAISSLEMVLKEMGYQFELGSGVKAAQVVLCAE